MLEFQNSQNYLKGNIIEGFESNFLISKLTTKIQ